MRRFSSKISLCLIPVILGGVVLGRILFLRGEGGFNLGVDLVGGTILVYEVKDPSRLPASCKPEDLAAALKRRIDPGGPL